MAAEMIDLVLLPGDGVGPEIVTAAKGVLDPAKILNPGVLVP